MKQIRLSLLTAALLISSISLSSCDDILHTNPEDMISNLSDVADLSYTKEAAPFWETYGTVDALNAYVDTYGITLSDQSLDGNLLLFTGSRANDPTALTPDEQNETVALVYHVQRNEIVYAHEYVAQIYEAASLNADTAPRALPETTVRISFDATNIQTGDLQRLSCLFTVYTSEIDRSTGHVTESTVLFDAEGREVASVAEAANVLAFGNHYYEFGNHLYRFADGQLSQIAAIPAYNRPVAFDYFDGAYFYCIEQNSVNIYSISMRHVYGWQEANPDKTVYMNVLDNGNILVQTIELLPEDAAEYNLISGKDKCRFTSTLLKPFVGYEQPLELDFIVHSVETRKANPESLTVYQPSVTNVATVTYIQDQRIDMNSLSSVALTNEGQIDKSLKIVESHVSVQEITSPGNGYFIVSENGQHHVYDNTGASLSTYNADLCATHSFLINLNTGTVYNYALETVYQCGENTSIADIGDNYVLLERRTGAQSTYFVYYDGSETVLYEEPSESEADTSAYFRYRKFYVLRTVQEAEETAEWEVYNVLGQQLGHFTAEGLHLYHESEHGALMQDASGHFYRIGE